jgi:hypothetical protein
VSGAFKNNPKAQSVNWDSTGSFRLRDGDARVIALPGDQAGLAAALVIAPGRPRPASSAAPAPGAAAAIRRPAASRPILKPSAPARQHPHRRPTDHPGSNDRLVTIATGDIYRQLKRRNSYGGHLQKVFQSLPTA